MDNIHEQKYIKYKNEYTKLKQLTQLNQMEGGSKSTIKTGNALEYSDWIKYAEKKKLFFGPKDYVKMESDKKYYISQIDYIKFLFIEYAKKFGIKANKVYDPLTFFSKFKSQIITKDNITKNESYVLRKRGKSSCCNVAKESINHYELNIDPKHDKTFSGKTMDISLYLTEKHWLASGSGDGYSRWMLWDNLAKMPKFYFLEIKNEDE